MTRVPFERLGHLIVVPVRLAGSIDVPFVFDTGIGVNILSKKFAEQAGMIATAGVVSGRRMSGQEIRMPIGTLPSLQLGDRTWEDLPVAPLDMGGFHPALKDLGGFLSLGPFDSVPFTLHYPEKEIEVPATSPLGSRNSVGYQEVPLAIRRDGPSIAVDLDLELPTGSVAHVEVDTGSDSLILHDRYRAEFDVRPHSANVRTVEGTDETGQPNVRHFATIPGRFRIHGTHQIEQEAPHVMFQSIIYDGLIGDDFLKRFRVSVDVKRARIGFAPVGP